MPHHAESTSGCWWWAEGPPEFAVGITGGAGDAFWSAGVEGVTDVGDGRGEMCPLVGGGSHGRGPGGDGLHQVYGPPGHRHVVIMLTPEISGVVDEPTTVTLPLDDVKRVAPAA